MKLVVYHHNGQLAVYPLDAVTGLYVEADPGETPRSDTQVTNETLAKLLKKEQRPPAAAPVRKRHV